MIDEHSLGDILEQSDAREVRRRPGGPRRPPLLLQLLRPEPMFWQLFSAGGFVAALLLPVTVAVLLITSAGSDPSETLAYDRVASLVDHILAKLYLLALISLPLFHWAHRFRYTVHHQFGVHGLKGLVAVACYGTAIAGSALAVLVLLGI